MKEIDRHHDEAEMALAHLTEQRAAALYARSNSFVGRLVHGYLDAAINDLSTALAGTCPEDPARLRGQPIGMYHCPTCGCMVLAGVDGHGHDEGCYLGLNDPDEG